MQDDELRAILEDPLTRELLGSESLARLAYSAPDGSPRVIPIGFSAREGRIDVYSEPSAPKFAALRADPRVAVTIDTAGPPPRALLLRGVAEIAVGPQFVDEYLELSRRSTPAGDWAAFEASARRLYRTMGRIAITPHWAKVLDFEQRMPEFLERLVRDAGGGQV
jgi:hypothetical protein